MTTAKILSKMLPLGGLGGFFILLPLTDTLD